MLGLCFALVVSVVSASGSAHKTTARAIEAIDRIQSEVIQDADAGKGFAEVENMMKVEQGGDPVAQYTARQKKRKQTIAASSAFSSIEKIMHSESSNLERNQKKELEVVENTNQQIKDMIKEVMMYSHHSKTSLQQTNCVMGNWSPWGDCEESCHHSRTRSVLVPPTHGGLPCPTDMWQTDICTGRECRKFKTDEGVDAHTNL